MISDGNDTNSRATVREIKSMIRSTEVMAYAIGIDTQGLTSADWGGQPSEPSYPPPRAARPDPAAVSHARAPQPARATAAQSTDAVAAAPAATRRAAGSTIA